MACMYGRCRRVVGVGVRCVQACVWRAMACVGTVYGAMALGVRMVYVVCTCVCVCTLCVRVYIVT